uniref:Large ribosomal subunit protein uL4 n=1 Tax=Candidatus Aschnera chinzeii TaxID=1485666 RepID=A0AAT9G476_9ENTR|nr:MAG: 50S ribosomal protein L4 [Candidatus Aschnera chinzeii]
MHLAIINDQEKIIVSNDIFAYKYHPNLIHQVIVAYAAGSRQGSSAQKNRANVAGSNKKPWRQKGTGRARAGSKKSPIWRSGGVTFAATPHKYKQKINKKMYRTALKSIFSELIRQNRLLVIKPFDLQVPKTKLLIEMFNNLYNNTILFIDNDIKKNIYLASRNLYKLNLITVNNINPIDLINYKKTIITTDAIKNIEAKLYE